MKRLPIYLMVLIFFAAIKVFATSYDFDDFRPPTNLAVKSPDGRFVLIMHPGNNYCDNIGKSVAYKTEDYKKNKPLWSVKGCPMLAELANTGEHIICYGLPDYTGDHIISVGPLVDQFDSDTVLAFYHKNKLIKKYKIEDFYKTPDAFIRQDPMDNFVQSFFIEQPFNAGFSDDGLRYTVVGLDKMAYEFDVTSGEIKQAYIDLRAMSNNEKMDFGERTWNDRMHRIDTLMKMGKPAVPELIEFMSDQDDYYRMLAARALAEIGPEAIEAVPDLIETLKHELWSVRSAAIYALINIGKPAVPALIHLLNEVHEEPHFYYFYDVATALKYLPPPEKGVVPDLIEALQSKNVNSLAFTSLKRMGPDAKEAVPVLINLVSDKSKDRSLRAMAAEIIGEIGDPTALPSLIQVIKHMQDDEYEDYFFGDAVVRAIGKMGPNAKEAVPALIGLCEDDPKYFDNNMSQTLAAIGKPAVPALIHLFTDEQKSESIHEEAYRTLIDMGSEASEAVPDLIKALRSKGKVTWYKNTISDILEGIGRPAITALTEVLTNDNEDGETRRAASWLLFKMAPDAKEVVPILINMLKDKNEDARFRAIAARVLGKIGSDAKEAFPLLINILKDKNEDAQFRAIAARVLGKIGSDAKEAFPVLINILKDKNEDARLRASAAYTLGEIGSDAKEVFPVLINILKDKNEDARLRASASEALGQVGKPAITALTEVLTNDNEDGKTRRAAGWSLVKMAPDVKEAVPALVEALKDENYHLDGYAIQALGNIGPDAKDAVPFIIEATHKDEKVIFISARAIWKIGFTSEEAVHFIAKISKMGGDYDNYCMGAPSVSVLNQILSDEGEDIIARRIAANALGKIESDAKEAVPGLIKALKDKDMELRKEAAYALGQIGIGAEAAVPILFETTKDENEEVAEQADIALWNIIPTVRGERYARDISLYSILLGFNPRNDDAYIKRGYAYKHKGDYVKAIEDYNKALEINPKSAKGYNALAWLLATCPNSKYRNGSNAVLLAKKAVELEHWPNYLNTLAAAYAEAGDFEMAVETEQKAFAKSDDPVIKDLIEVYKKKKTYIEYRYK